MRKAKMERAAVAEVNTLFKMFDIKAEAFYGPFMMPVWKAESRIYWKKFPFRIIVKETPAYRRFFSQADQMREYTNMLISKRVEKHG